jgi:hypothetical protein
VNDTPKKLFQYIDNPSYNMEILAPGYNMQSWSDDGIYGSILEMETARCVRALGLTSVIRKSFSRPLGDLEYEKLLAASKRAIKRDLGISVRRVFSQVTMTMAERTWLSYYKTDSGKLLPVTINITVWHNKLAFSAAGRPGQEDFMLTAYELVKETVEKMTKPAPFQTKVKYLYIGTQGGSNEIERNIPCPTWGEISGNYTPGTARSVGKIVQEYEDKDTGSLIIWTGVTGTGKTFALRALIDAWKDTQFMILIDPEMFEQL